MAGGSWLPVRSTSTTSAQISNTSAGGVSKQPVNATSTRSNSPAARRMRLYMRTAPPCDSGKGRYGLATSTRTRPAGDRGGARPGNTATAPLFNARKLSSGYAGVSRGPPFNAITAAARKPVVSPPALSLSLRTACPHNLRNTRGLATDPARNFK